MSWVRLDISAVPTGWSIVCSCGSLLDADSDANLKLAVDRHLADHLGEDE